MLKFDERGNLKPYGITSSTLEEMKNYFVDNIISETRQENFEKYLRYSADLKKYSGDSELRQWVNGSFVTQKPNPNDIDIVTFLSLDQIKKLGRRIDDFKMHNGILLYGVDGYIVEEYPPLNKYFNYTVSNNAYWNMQFSNAKPNRIGRKYRKGFLEVIY